MKVSIIIKALNEEKNIQRAIESSLKAIEEIGDGEVILADSLSTDETVKIASRYPVNIVQLKSPLDRSCGIGAELGLQIAKGKYVYILDADMEFFSGFLSKAIATLDQRPDLAGVGGLVKEMNMESIEFQERYKRNNSALSAGDVFSLNMGGLFRKEALMAVGYFTHMDLNSYEEVELAARLKTNGYKLLRLDSYSVRHYGHEIGAYKLLFKRVRSGYIFGIGELLRSAWGKPHFKFLISHLKQIRLYAAYLLWELCCLLLLAVSLGTFSLPAITSLLAILVLPFLIMIIKKRSISTGIYSVVASVFNSNGMLIGFFKNRIGDPKRVISYSIIKGDS